MMYIIYKIYNNNSNYVFVDYAKVFTPFYISNTDFYIE